VVGCGYQWERGGETRVWEGEFSTKCCVPTYINRKMRPAETVPGMGLGIKMNSEGGEFKYDIL
jgi:hypothetical protein